MVMEKLTHFVGILLTFFVLSVMGAKTIRFPFVGEVGVKEEVED